MTFLRWTALALSLAACSDGATGPQGPTLPKSTFLLEIHAVPTGDGGTGPGFTFSNHRVRLHLEPVDESGGTATLSAFGAVSVGTFMREGDRVTVGFPSATSLPAPNVNEAITCLTTRMTYASFSLTATDANRDGAFDTMSGDGLGVARKVSGDTEGSRDFEAHVGGSLESTGASISLSPDSDVHPLGALEARLHEPISASSLAITVEGVGLFEAEGLSAGMSSAFFSRGGGGTPFAWGTTYAVAPATGMGFDADGSPTLAATFTTATRPATFTDSGFETASPGLLRGLARLLTAQDAASPPAEGSQALGLRSDASLTTTFVSTTETELVVRLRYLKLEAQDEADPIYVDFFEGTERSTSVVMPEDDLVFAEVPGFGHVATGIETLRVALPSFATQASFAVQLGTRSRSQCGTQPFPDRSVVVESLALE